MFGAGGIGAQEGQVHGAFAGVGEADLDLFAGIEEAGEGHRIVADRRIFAGDRGLFSESFGEAPVDVAGAGIDRASAAQDGDAAPMELDDRGREGAAAEVTDRDVGLVHEITTGVDLDRCCGGRRQQPLEVHSGDRAGVEQAAARVVAEAGGHRQSDRW